MWNYQAVAFHLYYQYDQLYFYARQVLKKYVMKPLLTFSNASYDSSVIKIDEYDPSVLKKHCVFRMTPLMMTYVAFMGLFTDSKKWYEKYLLTTLTRLRHINGDDSSKVYIFTFYNGKQVISKNLKLPQAIQGQKRKWLMVLVNGVIDITTFYKQTMGSIGQSLGLTARELSGLALYDSVDSLSLVALAMNPGTFLSAINDDTFEETVFKGTDIVEL